MNKLVIDPQKLAEIRAAIDALDAPPAAGELPDNVKAFWFHGEPANPAGAWSRARSARNETKLKAAAAGPGN
jgi:hypothetical protein